MTELMRRGAVPSYLLLCLLLGGSATGIFRNLVLQLVGAALLFWAMAAKPRHVPGTAERRLLFLAGLLVGLVLLQVVPLPPALWSKLPGREPIISGFELLGRPLPWLPISLAPHQTAGTAVQLIPPLAILVAMIRIGYDPRWTAWMIILVALASVPLGIVQAAGGEHSPWRLYEFTNTGMTGLFANSNHLTALLLIATCLAASFLARRGGPAGRKGRFPFVTVAAIGVLGVGLVFIGALAGLLLLAAIAIGSVLCLGYGARHRARWLGLLLLLAAIGVTAALAGASLIRDPTGEISSSALPRYESFRLTIAAATDHFPAGSGVGTFREVYRTYEDPFRVTTTYMNHAHNDYLEIALEGGLPGLALILLFLLWWLAQARAVLASDGSSLLARAATLATAAVLLHSMVEYPLRVAAIAAAFGACCVMMAQPIPQRREEGA